MKTSAPMSPMELRGWLVAGVGAMLTVFTFLGIQVGKNADSSPKALAAQQTAISSQNEVVNLQLSHLTEALARVEKQQTDVLTRVETKLQELTTGNNVLERKLITLEAKWESTTLKTAEMAKAIEDLRNKSSGFQK